MESELSAAHAAAHAVGQYELDEAVVAQIRHDERGQVHRQYVQAHGVVAHGTFLPHLNFVSFPFSFHPRPCPRHRPHWPTAEALHESVGALQQHQKESASAPCEARRCRRCP